MKCHGKRVFPSYRWLQQTPPRGVHCSECGHPSVRFIIMPIHGSAARLDVAGESVVSRFHSRPALAATSAVTQLSATLSACTLRLPACNWQLVGGCGSPTATAPTPSVMEPIYASLKWDCRAPRVDHMTACAGSRSGASSRLDAPQRRNHVH